MLRCDHPKLAAAFRCRQPRRSADDQHVYYGWLSMIFEICTRNLPRNGGFRFLLFRRSPEGLVKSCNQLIQHQRRLASMTTKISDSELAPGVVAELKEIIFQISTQFILRSRILGRIVWSWDWIRLALVQALQIRIILLFWHLVNALVRKTYHQCSLVMI